VLEVLWVAIMEFQLGRLLGSAFAAANTLLRTPSSDADGVAIILLSTVCAIAAIEATDTATASTPATSFVIFPLHRQSRSDAKTLLASADQACALSPILFCRQQGGVAWIKRLRLTIRRYWVQQPLLQQ
jgi:hypothetical protein